MPVNSLVFDLGQLPGATQPCKSNELRPNVSHTMIVAIFTQGDQQREVGFGQFAVYHSEDLASCVAPMLIAFWPALTSRQRSTVGQAVTAACGDERRGRDAMFDFGQN